MASKNRVCLGCGDDFHRCSSCDLPSWEYGYCSQECWSASERAKACVALGERLRDLLTDEERFLLNEGIHETSCLLDKVGEGMARARADDRCGSIDP